MEYISWLGSKNYIKFYEKNVGIIGNGRWAKIMIPKSKNLRI